LTLCYLLGGTIIQGGHERILIINGRSVAEKVKDQMVLYFPTPPS